MNSDRNFPKLDSLCYFALVVELKVLLTLSQITFSSEVCPRIDYNSKYNPPRTVHQLWYS